MNAISVAQAFRLARDQLNRGIPVDDPSDQFFADSGAWSRPRYRVLSKRLDTNQGFVVNTTVIPDSLSVPDTSWVLIDGTHKTGDSGIPANNAGAGFALFSQQSWSWVPGAAARIWLPFPSRVRMQISADVVVPTSAGLARSTQQYGRMNTGTSLDGAPGNTSPPSIARLAFRGQAGVDPDLDGPLVYADARTIHFEEFEYGKAPVIPQAIDPRTPSPLVLSTSAGGNTAYVQKTPLWSRRRHSSIYTVNGFRGWADIGLLVNPRTDRVYVGRRVLSIEVTYRQQNFI